MVEVTTCVAFLYHYLLIVVFSLFLPGGGCTPQCNPLQSNWSLEDTQCENSPQIVAGHFPVLLRMIETPANILENLLTS